MAHRCGPAPGGSVTPGSVPGSDSGQHESTIGSIRQVQTCAFDQAELLGLAGKRFFPPNTDVLRKKYLQGVDPTLILPTGR